MTSRFYSKRNILHLLSTFALFILFLHAVTLDMNSDHVHSVLASFLQRGQLIIELYAPCSFLIRQHLGKKRLIALHALVKACISTCVLYPFFESQEQKIKCSFWKWASLTGPLPVLFILEEMRFTEAVRVAYAIGDLMLVLSVILSICLGGRRSGFGNWFSRVMVTTCLTLAPLFGCSAFDFFSLTMLATLCQLVDILQDVERTVSMNRVYIGVGGNAFSHIAFSVMIVLAATSIVYPASETSYGGNYNLRYLPATRRRTNRRPSLRPSNFKPAISTIAKPKHAVIPSHPISIYMPSAGFLWTDNLFWNEDLSVFVPKPDHHSSASPNSSSAFRAIFSDQISRVEPWVFEQPMSADYDTTNPYIISDLWSGEAVNLLSFSTTHPLYLTVSPERSNIDRINYETNDDTSADFVRWSLSMTAKSTKGSVWTVQYQPEEDLGFRLWNAHSACYLATSYRSFPDWDNEKRNDTILQELKLELEATCTRGVTKKASTFFVVDGEH
ncbi:hypothetical protein HYFRA_00012378 [Hymenoscyphus fraxineus]|uniref:Transmembrane protein n=1 Tax=Hymenoscyphus fraxineus TaxID=746836 RepID=A0A9N9PN23_9HELO|nr:hypothetical protein HYFRA_00012378 [Hymenoscyphus fraxineus]